MGWALHLADCMGQQIMPVPTQALGPCAGKVQSRGSGVGMRARVPNPSFLHTRSWMILVIVIVCQSSSPSSPHQLSGVLVSPYGILHSHFME